MKHVVQLCSFCMHHVCLYVLPAPFEMVECRIKDALLIGGTFGHGAVSLWRTPEKLLLRSAPVQLLQQRLVEREPPRPGSVVLETLRPVEPGLKQSTLSEEQHVALCPSHYLAFLRLEVRHPRPWA